MQDDAQDDVLEGTDDVTQDSGETTGKDERQRSRAKPQFDEAQNRWIGARLAREEDKRRAIEAELTTEKERATTATQRISTLERDLRLSRAENAVIAEATKLKADDPSIIFRLVKDDLQFGDDGKPKDVTPLLEQYKKDHPKLFGVASTSGADGGKGGDGGGDPTQGSVGDLNSWIREQHANSKARSRSSVEAL